MAAFEMSAENRKSRENNKRNKHEPTKSIQHRVTDAFDRVRFSQIAPPSVGSVRSDKTTPGGPSKSYVFRRVFALAPSNSQNCIRCAQSMRSSTVGFSWVWFSSFCENRDIEKARRGARACTYLQQLMLPNTNLVTKSITVLEKISNFKM